MSLVDEVLRAGTNFAALDFPTRDRYRHAIEDLARGSGRPEVEVARRVVARTKEAAAAGDAAYERPRDPGFHLLSRGRRALERELGFRVPLARRLARIYLAAAMPAYAGTIALLTALVLDGAPDPRRASAGTGPAGLVLFALLALVPATDLAIALANLGVVTRIEPRPLPKLELRDGVPPELRTLVVIPALLTSEAEVEELIAQLEVHYLANPDGELRFALLSDWIDAPAETHAGGRAACRGGGRSDRAPERAARPGARRPGALLPLPSRPSLERARGTLDGVGAQARKAARAQSPAARGDRHRLHAGGRAGRRRRRRAFATSSPSTPTPASPWTRRGR